MNLSALLTLADGWDTLAQADDALRQGSRVVQLEGLPPAARGFVLARLSHSLRKPMVVVAHDEASAAQLSLDLTAFLPEGQRVVHLPSSLSLLLDDNDSERDVSVAGKRLGVFGELLSGNIPSVLIASATALLQPVPPAANILSRRLILNIGETVNLDTLSVRLTAFGYLRSDLVRFPGSFARRGDILDIFPSDAKHPIRVDLFGDEIESIRLFDAESQRSEGKLEAVTIVPAHEVSYTRETMQSAAAILKTQLAREISRREALGESAERIEKRRDSAESDIVKIGQAAYFPGVERYFALLHPEATTGFALLPKDAILVLDEPAHFHSQTERDSESIAKHLEGRAERGEILFFTPPSSSPLDDLLKAARENRPTVIFTLLARGLSWLGPDIHLFANGAPAENFSGRPGALAETLNTWVRNEVRVVAVSAQAPRLRGMLAENKLSETPLPALKASGIALVGGVLTYGFRLPDARLVVLTDTELYGTPQDRRRGSRRKKEFRDGMRITSLLDIKAGDHVVHIHHGIGIYQGLVKMTNLGVEKEFIKVVYAGSDTLYVPTDQLDRVQKYIGSEGNAPAVHKLGGIEWLKQTARAHRQVREMAGELIQLYAARQAIIGHAYGADSPWMREMEDAFPYVETPDQLAAIEDVKRDLESPRPMDRLICGDVGFGKTEVAMRAAFKVASEGRQVAILCPTTVLAAQHFTTFSERMAAFPLRVDQLSRFRSPREQAQTMGDLKIGGVDIVVGTHRLLSKDIKWKDLGLVIVDEEQRFGVAHKERLKQLRQSVDVLAMSATPIPRTLHMSMSGIRDMSLINDPPEGRTAVKTYIKEYDDLLVREAIVREIERGGQVYFIHNRVESIYHVASHLEKLIPGLRFRVAHGQMNEDSLEDAMMEFYAKKYDVLIATTIIESGIDIPNVNTIIIDQADKLGLSQLYQLRGRVGRSPIQAYAYLFYQRNKTLKTIAEQRLDALREFTDLGSGYKVALRDLELRGAGNLLGAEQSGTVAAVGFDLYCQLLDQAMREFKGEDVAKTDAPLPTVDLPVAATIPEKYIPSEPQRILMYKKLAAVKNKIDVAQLQEEFEDRFGDPPPPVWNALGLLRLRMRCVEVGIESIQTDNQKIIIALNATTELPKYALRALTAAFKTQNYQFEAKRVVIPILSSKVLTQTEELVEYLQKALTDPPPAPRPESLEKRKAIQKTGRPR
jgi:transcription-repair coupling factor (superfamily II helicase)